MLKKILISLGVVTVLTFVSCGGESSKEAKEILQKILTIIGFPPEVITNICQTSNSSDICEGMKLHKLESSKTKTWQKIKETGVGQYLLETNNPCEPILLELKDSDVNYDSGEFFLKFSGVEYGKTTKELSILEAMVDASYLSASSVSSIKTLHNTEAQNKFYATLYRDLKTNINTLRTAGLTKTQSIRGTLKEMAEELKDYGIDNTLPTKINACNSDMDCVDGELTELSSKLLIYASETDVIVEAQKDNNAPLNVKEVSCSNDNASFIIDNETKLMWQDNSEAKEIKKKWLSDEQSNLCAKDSASSACFDTSGDTASTYCQNLKLGKYNDWRLPNRLELESILDKSKESAPYIIPIFNNVASSDYWTSSTDTFNGPNNALSIRFSQAQTYPVGKMFELHIRCVRN